MKRIKCTRKIGTIEQIITGIINDEVYDINHNVIGYVVEYRSNRNCLCSIKDFKIELL